MPRPPKKAPPFKTEVELCARFIAAIGEDWTAYPETAGWDILLVRKSDGFQIGVQAKLKLNAEVVYQALEDGSWYRVAGDGPDCRAVLVPWGDAGHLGGICGHLGVTVIRVSPPDPEKKRVFRYEIFSPSLPSDKHKSWREDWHEMAPDHRHKLPEYVPDVAAGASAPLQLTEWKIKAIKIAITLEIRGRVTRADFKHLQIDHRRWIAPEQGWLTVSDGAFVAGPFLPKFKKQHPVVYKQIKKDADKWLLPKHAVPPQQLGLTLR